MNLDERNKALAKLVTETLKNIEDTHKEFQEKHDRNDRELIENEKLVARLNDKRKNFIVGFNQHIKQYLEQLPGNREKVKYLTDVVADTQHKIALSITNGDGYDRDLYKEILDNYLLPLKEKTLSLLTLERDYPPLSDNIEKSQPVELMPNLMKAPIMIPVEITEAPLKTKTGKKLNNEKYIIDKRKFTWKDKALPQKIAQYVFEQKKIFDYHQPLMQEFLITGKCRNKIVFDGDGKWLATLFFILIEEDLLNTGNDFIAERIEQVFIRKSDSFKCLITKDSMIQALKSGSFNRRYKKDDKDYPDIVSYLKK